MLSTLLLGFLSSFSNPYEVWLPPGDALGPALQEAATACAKREGPCQLRIPPGVHHGIKKVELCPTVEISGVSEQLTELRFRDEHHGFHILPYGACRAMGVAWHGRVVLERMRITGYRTSTVTYGIWAENAVELERLVLKGWTQGIRLVVDGRRNPPGLANMWRIDQVRVYATDHTAVYVDGGDVNVGLSLGLAVTSGVCQDTEPFLHLGECAGIDDDGFLGSTYIGTHVSEAGAAHRSYNFTNPNARHVLIGSYAEGGMRRGWVTGPSMVLGGLSSWEGPGLWVKDTRIYGVEVINNLNPERRIHLKLGNKAGEGNVFSLQTNAIYGNMNWPLRMKLEEKTGSWRFDLGNVNITAFLRLHVDRSNDAFRWGTLRLHSDLLEIKE